MKHAKLLIILLLVGGFVGYSIWRSAQTEVAEIKLIGFQDSARPFTMPANGKPDMRFHFLSAWQANQLPELERMESPMGSENGALSYNAQKFWEMNEKRGGRHLGDDFNGIGGMNTDLGDPVFTVADGLVIYAGESHPAWGKTIIVAHRDVSGKQLHTMYAHLQHIKAPLNSLVSRGEILGSVGTSNDFYPAHLHFEIRSSDGIDIGAGYAITPLNRIDPSITIEAHHDSTANGISPSMLKIANRPNDSAWTGMEIENADKLFEQKK